MLFNLSADACGIGTFCTDGFPEAENSAMQHIRDCAILDLHKLVCPKKLEVFMATRTICFPISGYPYCREQPVTFTWIKGSKRQNIRAVHDAVHTTDPDVSILEVSSASVQPEGEAVSSLRLLLHLDSVAQDVPISTVFEATKVFEHGGPFADLLTCEPPKVHKDTRLRTSGELLRYKGKEFLLDAYQIALKNKTLQINIQKNKITFPMEEPDSGFHAVGVLTRSPAWEYGWKFNYLTENTSGAEKSEVKEKIPPKPLTALEHLERCGYRIVQQVVPKKLPPIAVQRMAWKTGEALCDPVVVDFLQFIRTHMQSDGSFSFRIPKGTSKNSFATLSEIAQTWDKMGLFASIVIYPQNIVYELAQNETVRHFLSGKWLELFVEHQVQQILNRYQEEQGAEVSLCSNVILSEAASAGSTHELDVVFSINGKFFWVEAKSSSRSIDYGKYAALCEKLKVTSDRLLLVNSDLSVEECEGVSYFWNYRVANCATITQELESMIAKQIEITAALSTD